MTAQLPEAGRGDHLARSAFMTVELLSLNQMDGLPANILRLNRQTPVPHNHRCLTKNAFTFGILSLGWFYS